MEIEFRQQKKIEQVYSTRFFQWPHYQICFQKVGRKNCFLRSTKKIFFSLSAPKQLWKNAFEDICCDGHFSFNLQRNFFKSAASNLISLLELLYFSWNLDSHFLSRGIMKDVFSGTHYLAGRVNISFRITQTISQIYLDRYFFSWRRKNQKQQTHQLT